jgi:serine/threonine-protein kinase HipA
VKTRQVAPPEPAGGLAGAHSGVDPAERLDVYFNTELVGWVWPSAPLAFEFAPAWLARKERMTLAAIAWQPGRQQTPAVQAFFENLLPEGQLRDYLQQQRQASTLYALLRAVAGDTAGGFTIMPSGQRPGVARYQVSSWPALAGQLRQRSTAAIDLHGQSARISLAGAQDKTSVAIFEDGLPRLPLGDSASTHIVKPNIQRLTKVWHSAANETLIMRTAAYCGLPTAEVFFEPHTQSCVVRRFDRVVQPSGTLARLVQYDLCQLASATSHLKYQKEGGPDLAHCAALIRHYSAQPAVDLRHLVRWVFFNLYVGNNDSHAKNLSLYHVPGRGVMLTPFYDLLCTRLYPGLSPHFAFSIGGEYSPGNLSYQHLEALAAQLGMRANFLKQQAAELAFALPAALAQAIEELAPLLPHAAKALVGQLQLFVLSTTKKTAKRFNA